MAMSWTSRMAKADWPNSVDRRDCPASKGTTMAVDDMATAPPMIADAAMPWPNR